MFYYHADYPAGPPGTSKGKLIIHFGGKEIVCENAVVVMTAKLTASVKVAKIAKLDSETPVSHRDC